MFTVFDGATGTHFGVTIMRLDGDGLTPVLGARDMKTARRMIDLLNRHGMEDVPLDIDPEDHDYERKADK